jgi:hypothetical protein
MKDTETASSKWNIGDLVEISSNNILSRNKVRVIESLEPYGCPKKLEEYRKALRKKRAIHPDVSRCFVSSHFSTSG